MILASQSPRRIDILRQVGIEPDVRPQDVDETPLAGEHPKAMVARLAQMKADAAAESTTRADEGQIIVAADTIVWMDDVEFGKPVDDEDAARMLRELSGRTHHVTTGVAVVKLGEWGVPERRARFTTTTDVTFFDLTDEEIAAYVATGEPRDKAGAYGYQAGGCTLVRRINGDYYNVVGLPIGHLLRVLTKFGRA